MNSDSWTAASPGAAVGRVYFTADDGSAYDFHLSLGSKSGALPGGTFRTHRDAEAAMSIGERDYPAADGTLTFDSSGKLKASTGTTITVEYYRPAARGRRAP